MAGFSPVGGFNPDASIEELDHVECHARERRMPGVLREVMERHPLPPEPRPLY